MATVGGDTINAKVIHPTIGSHSFSFKSDEDATVKLGGFKSDDDEGGITGDGQFIDKLTRTRGVFETPPVSWDQIGNNELGILQDLASSPDLGDWTITNVSGAIYGGLGKPVGDLAGNTNTGLIPLVLHFESLKQLQ